MFHDQLNLTTGGTDSFVNSYQQRTSQDTTGSTG
jgi:hypothetical protein